MLYLSGQVGVKPDGATPKTIGEQADQVFLNIVTILESQGLSATDIVKLTSYMIIGHNGEKVREARIKYLGAHRPASTAVYVSQLVNPEWYVEVASRKSD